MRGRAEMARRGRQLLGFQPVIMEPDRVKAVRRTLETVVEAEVNLLPRDPALKEGIRTPHNFLNHMLETLAWRACMNIAVSFEDVPGYRSGHVVCEDIGMTLGEILKCLWEANQDRGINGAGYGVMGIDEALARCVVSFENRAKLFFTPPPGAVMERVADMLATDLAQFLDGLAQGGRLTLHADVLKGGDPHHMWESVFRALGEAVRCAFAANQWRGGATPGLKGF